MKSKQILQILSCVVLVALIVFSASIFETNDYGNYQVKQSIGTGEISIKSRPGMYFQNFGTVHTYRLSDEIYFSKSDLDGGSSKSSQPVIVRFNDGSKAKISGMIKFRLSSLEKDQKRLHIDFKSYNSLKNGLIRQVITEALMQTATLMKAEESYSTRRAEFTDIAERQLVNGIFETYTEEKIIQNANGAKFMHKITKIKKDKNGNFVIRKKSPLKQYGIEIIQFVIKDLDFDSTIDSLIAKKKEAEQQKIVAIANAEKAKQDAITVREQGKAEVAKAEALALIEQKTAVINAQKERKVAEENAKKAEAEARAVRLKGEADAYTARLKVQAGLTPLQKAEIKMKTAIGVADKLSQVKFPEMLVIGGGGKNGNALNPFDAVGLESLIKISDKMTKNK